MAQRYAAFLRGINVGPAKRVAMSDLVALIESLGFRNVRTLLNSGNVVFEGPDAAPGAIASRIRAAVAGKLGVDALAVVRTASEMTAVAKGNKLSSVATNPSLLLVTLADPATLKRLAAIARTDWKSETVHVGKDAVYTWCPNGSLQSKVAVALLNEASATTRNWATIGKINALLASPASPRGGSTPNRGSTSARSRGRAGAR